MTPRPPSGEPAATPEFPEFDQLVKELDALLEAPSAGEAEPAPEDLFLERFAAGKAA
jgi:hypothetical protein